MAENFPGPYAVELNYAHDGINHKALLSAAVSGTPSVGDDPTTILLATKGGTDVPLNVAVDNFVAVYRPMFAGNTSIISYDFWLYTQFSFERTYITTGQIGVNGSSGSSTVKAGYRKISFRTQLGGLAFITALEGTGIGNEQESYPFASNAVNTLADWVVSDDSWILARDNSYCADVLRKSEGQNESIFRRRYRAS